jgi:hypothetical protein
LENLNATKKQKLPMLANKNWYWWSLFHLPPSYSQALQLRIRRQKSLFSLRLRENKLLFFPFHLTKHQ